MKNSAKRLISLDHAARANALLGAAGTVAGLFQANSALMIAGSIWVMASTGALILVRMPHSAGTAEMVFAGQLIDPQQPQLPDVQVHRHRTPELSKVA